MPRKIRPDSCQSHSDLIRAVGGCRGGFGEVGGEGEALAVDLDGR